MTDVVLDAEEHFVALREGVWRKLAARHGTCTRERFDEAYAEWWAREVERAAAGRPSRAQSPLAFLAEAVHRVLLDDARARARGIGRAEKGSLEFVDLDAVAAAASTATPESDAGYEALVHRVLTLVHGRLSPRELRVFVYCYLYMATTEDAAAALGLSVPRVRKDRDKVVRKVGEQVWAVLNGELDLCAAYDRKALGAVFELLSVHVEDCPTCGAALGGVRSGALAVLPPAVLLGPASETVVDGLSHAVDSLSVRFSGALHRASETVAAFPGGGRTAAVVAVTASAVAGGAATVPELRHHGAEPRQERAARSPAARATASPVATATAPAARVPISPTATATARVAHTAPRRAARALRQKESRARATPAPVATATREVVGFEAQTAPPVATAAPRSAQVASSSPTATRPAPAPRTQELGFERP